MLPYNNLAPEVFLANVGALLDDPAGRLVAQTHTLLARLSPRQRRAFITVKVGEGPTLTGHIGTIIPLAVGGTAGLLGATITHLGAKTTHQRRVGNLERLIARLDIARSSISLDEKERGLVRGMAALFAAGRIQGTEWDQIAATLTWGDGKATVMAAPDDLGNRYLPEARQVLADMLRHAVDSYSSALADASARIAREATHSDALGQSLRPFLQRGSRWMTPSDIQGSSVLSFDAQPSSLLVGHERDSGRPIYFGRNESLFSIGGPGTGKTECQVLPNLLSYKGSALVLDVKGELWEKSAGWRAKNVGPVYRFAPTDPSGRTHRYNPFDFISADPKQAATDCEVMSFQVIAPTANHHDPYWENRGRDFLWALAMAVALQARGRARAMSTLMRLLSVPLDVKTTAKDFDGSDTAKLIRGLDQLATQHGVPALAEHANAVRGGLGSQRLESVADNARRFLNIFSRSASLRAAMSTSDWRPEDLRTRPGTTVYLCLAGDDLDTFAPIIRLMLQQHANALLRDFTLKAGEPPITFFLDEFPQLKRMDAIMRMVDTGRGAGLRLWFFAQYLGQVRHAYDKQADGLINSCRVRSFLSPDAEAAEFIRPYLGNTTNLFTGEKTPLAEPHALLGGEFADRIITLSSGPAQLAKRYAWQTLADRMLPPPVVPVRAGRA